MISASVEWANHPGGIAIVGMAGRFPGADDVEQFWLNLRNGVESIRFFSDAELLAAGIDPSTFRDSSYLPASGFLPGIENFDAEFFGFTPREAQITDPQHRLFLESAWNALENAGYDPKRYSGLIGVYAGCGTTEYLWRNVYPRRKSLEGLDDFQLFVSSDKDFLSTRVSYKLDLHGPSLTIQTACSTSLVTVCVACQALLTFQCDMALAGGVSVDLRGRYGRLYREGMPMSPDGHCRAFDKSAQGTVGGDGVGVVVLKRLEDALAKGDHIYAVIKGAGLNNDGSGKIGYTAPSIDGQAQAVAQAMAVADMQPSTVQYIEAHGTGTPLGDPIELAALTAVYRGVPIGSCAIGSVKTNVGHLNTAAGIAGLIKTVQALRHREIPPSLHFVEPNPKLELLRSPFYVNTKLVTWPAPAALPRRAGVSSFGIGGTNAHVVLEEAPPLQPTLPSRPFQLLTLSARTEAALAAATTHLATALATDSALELPDTAYTLHTGRRAFSQRCFVVCKNKSDARDALIAVRDKQSFRQATQTEREVAFLFPGIGTQYPDMGRELYETEPLYRDEVTRCAQLLSPHLGFDVRRELYPDAAGRQAADERLQNVALSVITIFITEYALAQLLRSWGIVPRKLIGHSLGEYTAACLAGVFSLEDALRIVAARGRLMARAPRGAMLSLPIGGEEALAYLSEKLSIAAINGPENCVISGPIDEIDQLQQTLKQCHISVQKLRVAMGAHSILVEPILAEFEKEVAALRLCPPQLPFISNVSGTWIREEEAISPAYWAQHLRKTVRFSDGLATLLGDPQRILLEVGPGQTLRSLAAQHPQKTAEHIILSSMRTANTAVSDLAFLLQTVGKVWASGGAIDWQGFHRGEKRRHVPLPTYPFERQPFWLEAPHETALPVVAKTVATPQPAPPPVSDSTSRDWFYRPVFRAQKAAPDSASPTANWLILTDRPNANRASFGETAARLVAQRGDRLVLVQAGVAFSCDERGVYTIRPSKRDDFAQLFDALHRQKQLPDRILHLWNLSADDDAEDVQTDSAAQLDRGFYSLLALAQALDETGPASRGQTSLTVLTRGLFRVAEEPLSHPLQATAMGPILVLPKEYAHLRCQCVDLSRDATPSEESLRPILSECAAAHSDSIIALRQAQRFVQTYEKTALPLPAAAMTRLRDSGVYLITGGLSGIGLELAAYLVQTVKARLVLIGRSPPSAQAEQRIKELEATTGTSIVRAQADVADRAAMKAVIDAARQRFGQIHGVIHAAGIAGGGALFSRSLQAIDDVLHAKIHGTLVLDELLQNDGLDCVIFCSSLNAILGVFGQIDYTAANAFLDAFAQHKRGAGKTHYLSINWDAWRDVGMAARAAPESISALKEPRHPLLQSVRQTVNGDREYSARIATESLWLFHEHRLLDQPTLPGTAYLDLAVAAAEWDSRSGAAIELHDVVLKAPLADASGQPMEVNTRVWRRASDREFAVTSHPAEQPARAPREHCRGVIADSARPSKRPHRASLAELTASCSPFPLPAPDATPMIDLGPRWRCVRRLWRGDGEGVAELELPAEYAADLTTHALHPALLDCALSFVGLWLPATYVPYGYERVRIFAPLPRVIISQIYYAIPDGALPDTLELDVTIRDPAGPPLVEVLRYTLRRLHVSSR